MTTAPNGVPNFSLIDGGGPPTLPWYSFFVSLWTRTGSGVGMASPAVAANVATGIASLSTAQKAALIQSLLESLPVGSGSATTGQFYTNGSGSPVTEK